MSKKAKTELCMTGYPAFSPRRWQELLVADVGSGGRGTVRFVFTPVDNPGQAGRRINHDLPNVLAPGSPLAEFLATAMGIKITTGQTIDLSKLVGRHVMAKFGEPATDGNQAIVEFKPYTAPAAKPKSPPVMPTGTNVTGNTTGKPGGV